MENDRGECAMIDHKKSQGGRPSTPRNAAECREAISRETVNQGRERRLRWLYRLLKAFVAAEEMERQDRRLTAQNAANELKASELALKRSEYRRRFASTEHGQQALLSMVERLESELASVKANSGSMPTLTESAGDCECK